MILGTTIAIAAGLNPYVTALIVAALAGLASRVQVTGPLASVDPTMWRTAIAFAAVLAGIDLTVGKLRHRFLMMRLASFGFAVVAGAVAGQEAHQHQPLNFFRTLVGKMGSHH